jgi:hypothetical protein
MALASDGRPVDRPVAPPRRMRTMSSSGSSAGRAVAPAASPGSSASTKPGCRGAAGARARCPRSRSLSILRGTAQGAGSARTACSASRRTTRRDRPGAPLFRTAHGVPGCTLAGSAASADARPVSSVHGGGQHQRNSHAQHAARGMLCILRCVYYVHAMYAAPRALVAAPARRRPACSRRTRRTPACARPAWSRSASQCSPAQPIATA